MKLSILVKTTSLILGITLSIFTISLIVFSWTAPTQNPPTCPSGSPGCDRPLHEGAVTQSKVGGLNIGGNVGIGTTAPTARLDVNGDLNIAGEQIGGTSWGFKEGPTEWVSAHRNRWHLGGGAGNSIDCTSSANGCTILRSGTYSIRCVQRAADATSPFIGLALDGSRAALEDRTDAMWNHDHGPATHSYSESNFLGTLASTNFITCGAGSSTTSLVFGTTGWSGSMKIIRIR